MIRRITSSLTTFKTISFGAGLNLVVSEKSQGATDRQTRNSSGKSSLLAIMHLLLGSKCDAESLFRRDSLLNEDFSMTLDIRGDQVAVTRTGATPNRVFVSSSDASWPLQPKADKKSGDTYFSNDEWKTVLGWAMFGLAADLPPFGPSFRSLISYFVRRESSGGFQDATQHSSQQQNWDRQISLSYLLGLDWRIPHELQSVRMEEQSLKTLRKEAKAGVLGRLVGSSGEIRTRLTVSERHARQLAKDLAGFQVLPEYRELEREASGLAVQISRLANENTLDRERIEATSQQLVEEHPPRLSDIERMYREAEVVLPSLVKQQFSDVERFHQAIIRNRRIHLEGEIEDARRRIAERESTAHQMDERRRHILNTLASHGALDQMHRLQEELSRQQAEVEELRKKLEMARQLESQSTELAIERAQIHKKLSRDLEDREELLKEAIVTFEEFSQRISDHEGSLVVTPTENGPRFDVIVEGGESKGIRNMQIFCFDMMLAVLWGRRSLGPGFLVHDSHLFDGMDSRQIGKAIEIGAQEASVNGFQYIVTLNSDVLESAEFSDAFDASRHLNPVRLSDETETGGIFGKRV